MLDVVIEKLNEIFMLQPSQKMCQYDLQLRYLVVAILEVQGGSNKKMPNIFLNHFLILDFTYFR